MSQGEREYFLFRARQERSRAELCADPSAAHVHRMLAEEYDRRAGRIAVRMTIPVR